MPHLPLALPLATAALLAAGLTAQSSFVSPAGLAQREGNSGNAFPFANTSVAASRRYQQVHSDLGAATRTIRALRFRLSETTQGFGGTSFLDLEMVMGPAVPWNTIQTGFDQNWTAAPTTVIGRKIVQFGPQGAGASPGPAPFGDQQGLFLDAPFLHAGPGSLGWEVRVHGAVQSGALGANDAHAATPGYFGLASTGEGCVASGQSGGRMSVPISALDVGGTVVFAAGLVRGPASAPALLAMGVGNPNLALPGLCGRICTDLLLVVPMGSTDPSGAISSSESGFRIVLPNTFGGARLQVQAHALDMFRSDPLRVANSDGVQVTFPNPGLPTVQASRLFNNAGGVLATQGLFLPASMVGYALVTEFVF